MHSDQLITTSLFFYLAEQLSHYRDHAQGLFSLHRKPAPFGGDGGRRKPYLQSRMKSMKGAVYFALRNGVDSSGEGRRRRDICFSLSGYN